MQRDVFTYISQNWSHFMGEPEPSVHWEDIHPCREFLERVLVTG
ncbi:MAG: hypothetical protein R6U13_11815 [Desulfatiglandaceae bacterium]